MYAATMQAMYDNRREHFQMLLDADVLLLQGTDSGGYQEHGSIAGELDLWARWGASARTIIDASDLGHPARTSGRPGLVEAGPADLLILDEDSAHRPPGHGASPRGLRRRNARVGARLTGSSRT